MAVVTCFYNPERYYSRLGNYYAFLDAAESQGADVFTIECRILGDDWQLRDSIPNLYRVQTTSVLWHKERLLNIAIKKLPRRYDSVAWVDCDVLFDNPDWVVDSIDCLNNFKVCQLFDRAYWLNRQGVPYRWWSEVKDASKPSIAVDSKFGHPGFAWAARRSLIEKLGGLWDCHIIGSGDTVMWSGFSAMLNHRHISLTSESIRSLAMEWMLRAAAETGGKIGHIPGAVRHLWHGDRERRRYDDRLFFTNLAEFDPVKHLITNECGCWEWSYSAPRQIVNAISRYFAERMEDGDEF